MQHRTINAETFESEELERQLLQLAHRRAERQLFLQQAGAYRRVSRQAVRRHLLVLTLAAGLLVATLSIASGHLLPYPITTSHNANSIAMYEQADLLTQLI